MGGMAGTNDAKITATPGASSGTTIAAAGPDGVSDDNDPSDDESPSVSFEGLLQTAVATAALAASKTAPGAASDSAVGANAADATAMSNASLAGPVMAARPAAGPTLSLRAVSAQSAGNAADRHARSDAQGAALDASAGVDVSPWGVNAGASGDPAPVLQLTAGVTQEFSQGLADHVSALLDSKLTSATLQVNPPQLGPIEIRVSVQGDHALVSLMSHSAVTRDALESSSMKLREMLGGQGFSQVSVDVAHRHFQDRPTPRTYDEAPRAQPFAARGEANDEVSSAAAASLPRTSGVLDAYA
jgi:flagellar hook-length control protein FliK